MASPLKRKGAYAFSTESRTIWRPASVISQSEPWSRANMRERPPSITAPYDPAYGT